MKTFLPLLLGLAFFLISPVAVSAQQSVVYDIGFGSGAEGWQGAELIKESLPQGSAGAIKAAKDQSGAVANIHSPVSWVDGLFPVSENLYFNFRVKVEKKDWYLIFLCIKPAGPEGPQVNYIARGGASEAEGDWAIVSIPFSDFKPASTGEGTPADASQAKGIVSRFFFDFQKRDLGFQVDRIWVTAGGPVSELPK